jgi:hypothetical protein
MANSSSQVKRMDLTPNASSDAACGARLDVQRNFRTDGGSEFRQGV